MSKPDRENVVWKIRLQCGFEESKNYVPRKCNGTTAVVPVDDSYCLEDTTFQYWYVNNKLGNSVWASTRALNVYGRVKFYSMTDFALGTISFYTKKLNATVLNGPSTVSIAISPHAIYNKLTTDKRWGRYFGEFKLDYDRFRVTPENLKSKDYWVNNENPFVLVDAAEYIDNVEGKVVLLWWHWLLIILSIVIFIVLLSVLGIREFYPRTKDKSE